MFTSYISSMIDVHCLSSSAPFTPEDFLNLLIPNFWAFLIQLLALIVLITAIIFFAYKPIRKIIKKRADYVENNIKDSQTKVDEANKNLDEAKQTILKSREQANEIVKKAENDAVVVKENILNKAELDASKKIEEARQQIKDEQEKAKEDIHKEIVNVALTASEKLLNREINQKDNDELISNFVDDIQKKDKK